MRTLHRIVNDAIRTQTVGDDQAEGLTFDLSEIALEGLRDEFAKKVRRKATALQDIRDIVEQKLAEMLARNPMRMDYQSKYEDIVADHNREKDRTTIEETFRRLVELVNSLDEEQKRAASEGQCLHHADPGQHCWPVTFRDQRKRLRRSLPQDTNQEAVLRDDLVM